MKPRSLQADHLALEASQVTQARHGHVKHMCCLPQRGDGGMHGLKYFLVRSALELTTNRCMHQCDAVSHIGLSVGKQHRTSIRQRSKFSQIVGRPKNRCVDKREGVVYFLDWVTEDCRILKRACRIIGSHPQRSCRVKDGRRSDMRYGQFIAESTMSITVRDADRNENGRNRSYSLHPSGPIGFAQIPRIAQPEECCDSACSNSIYEHPTPAAASYQSCHDGILA